MRVQTINEITSKHLREQLIDAYTDMADQGKFECVTNGIARIKLPNGDDAEIQLSITINENEFLLEE